MRTRKLCLQAAPLCGLAFAIVTISPSVYAQTTAPNEWTWMGGSSSLGSNNGGQPGVYGTLGTPAPGNIPGGRWRATTWTDSKGNFWLFGGEGFDVNGAYCDLNDLWQFNPSTNQWAWISGANAERQPGVYGTLGIPAPGNVPGARAGATGWADRDGNFWIFGGDGIDAAGSLGYFNDLWKFNPSTGEWTWMGGASEIYAEGWGYKGVYGTLGTAAASNAPGSRAHAMGWADGTGGLWLFGGDGDDANLVLSEGQLNFGVLSIEAPSSLLNDVWEYTPSMNEWTWSAGSSTGGQPGMYGTLGSPASANNPGGRELAASWTDSNGSLWLFGGWGLDSSGPYSTVDLNDLWEFNPQSNQWAWISGSSTVGSNGYVPGVAATSGVPAVGNVPGSRWGAVGWNDSNGNFWIFGGEVFVPNGYNSVWAVRNDLWKFNPATSEWAWMGGGGSTPIPSASFSLPGVYGVLGTAAAGNFPGSRSSASSWTDNRGNLWLFGGAGVDSNGNAGSLNDMWVYAPYPTAAAPTFGLASGNYAATQTVTISDTTPNATIYYTTDGDTAPTTSSAQYTGPIVVTSSETINAIAVAENYLNSGVASAAYRIVPPADAPIFSLPGGTYLSAQTVTIIDTTPGAVIHYTTNGTNSTVYNGAITVSATETIEAIATANDFSASPVATAAYTITPPAAAPTFSVSSGIYTTNQIVTISDTTPGAIIYYTTNGTPPTTNSTVYNGAITVSATEILEAIATANGFSVSPVAAAAYTIAPPAAAPAFSVPGGTYSSSQTVTISDTTPGAIIFYTTDGTVPTLNSAVYSSPILVSSTKTIEAIATASAYSVSAVASATYTIPPDFTLSLSPNSISVLAGQSGTTTITMQEEGGFNSDISFACTGLPTGAACSFATEPIPTPPGVIFTKLTVTTASTTAQLHRTDRPLIPGLALAIAVCCFGFKNRRRLQMLLLLAVIASGLGFVSGCGGASSGSKQPATSIVVVTATSALHSHSTTFSLTVN